MANNGSCVRCNLDNSNCRSCTFEDSGKLTCLNCLYLHVLVNGSCIPCETACRECSVHSGLPGACLEVRL